MGTVLLGENVRKFRQLRGMKMEELCAGICSVSQLSKIETGKVQVRDTQLKTFAERLRVSVEQLQTEDGIRDQLKDQLRIASRACTLKKYEMAVDLARKVREQSAECGYPDLHIEAVYTESRIYFFEGRWSEANELLSATLRSGLPIEPERLSDLWGELGRTWVQMGDMDTGLRCMSKAVHFCEELPVDHPEAMRMYFRLSSFHMSLHRYREAVRCGEIAYRLADRANFYMWKLRSAMMIGNALLRMGRVPEAIELLQVNLDEAERNQMVFEAGLSAANLGDYYLTMGKLAEARTLLERGLRTLELESDKGLAGYWLCDPRLGLAKVALCEGHDAQAEYQLDRVQEIIDSMVAGGYLYQARLHKARAECAAKQGLVDEHLAQLQNALAVYERHRVFYEGWQTAVQIAEVLEQTGSSEALAMYRRAFALYSQFEAIGV